MNILCQTKNINSVLEQCKSIYPTLFSENRPSSNHSRSPASSRSYSRTRSPSPQSKTSKKRVECSNEVDVYRIEEIGEPRELRQSTPRTPEGRKTPVQRNDFLNLDLEKLNRNTPLSPPLTPDTVRVILESVFERIFELEKAKNPEKGFTQHLNKEDVQKIVGEVLNEAVKSPSICGAGEGEYFGCANLRTKNNALYIDYDRLKTDLIHSDNDRKIRILQALRWKVTKSDSATREKILESYVNNDLLDLFANISIPERLLLGYGTDHYVQESICRLINTLASLKQGRDYLTLDERLLKRVLVKKVKDVRTISGAVTRNMLIASVQKLSIRKQCRNQLVKEGLLEVIIDYMDEFYEKLSKYCLEYCSALLMNLCLVDEAKNRSIKEPNKVVGLIRKFLASENEIYLPYINGIMFSLFEKKELIQEAKNQELDKIITKLIPLTKDENVKKQLDFILQSRLLGKNDPSIRDDEDDHKEEFDLLEAELDQDDFITQLPSGEALLVEYLTEDKPKSSLSCGIRRDPPNSARSFSEERKEFTHKPTSEAIFETAKPRRFTTCSQNLLRNSMRTKTMNRQSSIGRYPATPLCYMESCQKLENGSSAPCSCSKCVPGRSKYSCGCYEAIRKEIGHNNEELSVIKKYNGEDTKIRW